MRFGGGIFLTAYFDTLWDVGFEATFANNHTVWASLRADTSETF